MKGFIFAAGFGKRLRPLTRDIPKPLIPVCGIPSICFSLSLLKKSGIGEIVCNLHYRYDRVLDFFRKNRNFGLKIDFSVEEELLGTGGGLKRCESLLKNDSFFLLNSDIITDLNPEKITGELKRSGKKGILALAPLDEGRLPGTVSVKNDLVADINGLLKSGIPSRYDYMGAALLTPAIFEFLVPEPSCIVRRGFTGMAKEENLGSFIHKGVWTDIGSPEKRDKAEKFLLGEGRAIVDDVRSVLGGIK